MGDADQTGPGEGGGVIGKTGDAEACQKAEGEIQGADENSCGIAGCAGWDAEVGYEPETVGRKGGREAPGEIVHLVLGEAIEEEVGDDEVGWGGGDVGEGALLVGLEARAGVDGRGPAVEELQHGGADVYGIGVELTIAFEELGEEAAVAVAENQGSSTIVEAWEEVGAGALEQGAEGEVLKPAVGAGDGVEVGLGVCSQRGSAQRAQARPSAPVPASMTAGMVQLAVSITATCLPQET